MNGNRLKIVAGSVAGAVAIYALSGVFPDPAARKPTLELAFPRAGSSSPSPARALHLQRVMPSPGSRLPPLSAAAQLADCLLPHLCAVGRSATSAGRCRPGCPAFRQSPRRASEAGWPSSASLVVARRHRRRMGRLPPGEIVAWGFSVVRSPCEPPPRRSWCSPSSPSGSPQSPQRASPPSSGAVAASGTAPAGAAQPALAAAVSARQSAVPAPQTRNLTARSSSSLPAVGQPHARPSPAATRTAKGAASRRKACAAAPGASAARMRGAVAAPARTRMRQASIGPGGTCM